MEYRLKFSVSSRDADAEVPDQTFVAIEKMFENTGANPKFNLITSSFGDPRITTAFSLIYHATGRKPVADLHFARNHKESHFPVSITRTFDETEIQNAEYLLLRPPNEEIGEFDTFTVDGQGRIRMRGKPTVGLAGVGRMWWLIACTSEFKEKLTNANMIGVDFRPIEVIGARNNALWQLWSRIQMPPLALPFRDRHGNPVNYTHGAFCGINDGSYNPPVLLFKPESLAQMPEFDVAITCERFGKDWNSALPYIVVSQRFRGLLLELGLHGMNYSVATSCSLDEYYHRFTIPELAPPVEELIQESAWRSRERPEVDSPLSKPSATETSTAQSALLYEFLVGKLLDDSASFSAGRLFELASTRFPGSTEMLRLEIWEILQYLAHHKCLTAERKLIFGKRETTYKATPKLKTSCPPSPPKDE